MPCLAVRYAPGFQHLILNDTESDAYMATRDPEIAATYLQLKSTAHRADLLRYCLLLENGGLYVDMVRWLVRRRQAGVPAVTAVGLVACTPLLGCGVSVVGWAVPCFAVRSQLCPAAFTPNHPPSSETWPFAVRPLPPLGLVALDFSAGIHLAAHAPSPWFGGRVDDPKPPGIAWEHRDHCSAPGHGASSPGHRRDRPGRRPPHPDHVPQRVCWRYAGSALAPGAREPLLG